MHLLIEESYKRAKQILTDNYEKVEALAKILLEREVIFTEDVRNILGERPFETEKPEEPAQNETPASEEPLETADTADESK